MSLPMIEAGTGPGWQLVYTATIAYCQVGQHFVEANSHVYRYWQTPLKSIACVCVECAEEGEE